MKDDVLPLPSNICYVGHSLCSSCDGYSVLNYKQYKFLVEILELLVFFGLCHAFHRHTLSQHNPLGYLNFILYSPQYTQKFCLHISKAEIEVQTTWMHTYGCYFIVIHVLDPKRIFFTTVIVKSETSICLLVHLVEVVDLHSHLQSWNPLCTMKLMSRFLPHANASTLMNTSYGDIYK